MATSLCLANGIGHCDEPKAETKSKQQKKSESLSEPPSLAFLEYLAALEPSNNGWVSPTDMEQETVKSKQEKDK